MVRLLIALVALSTAAGARAQDAPCAEPVRAWVDEAADATGVRIEAVQCPPSMVRVRLHPEGAGPIDVEVAEPPGPAFRHAGRFRTSPIVDVPDYEVLPEPQRRGYEALVEWIAAHEESVRLDAPAAVPEPARELIGLGLRDAGWWLLGAALGLAALGLWRARPAFVDWRPAVALLAVGGAARIGLGVWGPFHVNGQGPLWIRGALRDPGLLSSYGPGYAELLGPIARAGGAAPDEAIFAANVALSALAPVLLFAVGRAVGIERNRALLGALLLALDPISARLAASESYVTPIATLALASMLLVVLGASRLHERRAISGVLLLGAAALFAAQAARIHPVGWAPLALVPLVALTSDGEARWWRRGALGAGTAVLFACVAWTTSGAWLAAVADAALSGGPGAGVLANLGQAGFAGRAPVAVLLAAVALVLARPRAAVVIGLLAVLAPLATRHAYGQSEVWQAAYDRLYAPYVALAVAALAPRTLSLPWSVGISVAFAAALSAVHGPALLEPTTEQAEYAFLREQLRRVPEDCRVAHLARADRRGVEIPDWAHPHPRAALRIDDASSLRAAAAGRCVFWVHTSICASAEGGPRCDAIESRVSLDPAIARRTFPARPSYDDLPYDADRVPVTIRRVRVALRRP